MSALIAGGEVGGRYLEEQGAARTLANSNCDETCWTLRFAQARAASDTAAQERLKQQQALEAQRERAEQLRELNQRLQQLQMQGEQQQWRQRWAQPPPQVPSAMPGRLSTYPD